jgi:hypothetical protein
MAQEVPAGVARSLARARQFGRSHTKPQPVGPVTVTLRDSLAPSLVVGPSPHPTKVVTPKGDLLADLKPGERAEFVGTVTPARSPEDAPSVAWSRKVAQAKADLSEPFEDPSEAEAPPKIAG